MIEYFLISVLSAFGLSVILVEKSDEGPVFWIHSFLKAVIGTILGERAARFLDCTVCTSFWAALVIDIFLYLQFTSPFLFPLTSFAAMGLSWFIIQILNLLDMEIDFEEIENESEDEENNNQDSKEVE